MNGTRRREDSSSGAEDSPAKRQANRSVHEALLPSQEADEEDGANHYDIYVVPSSQPLAPALVWSGVHYQDASFVVVNRAAGLAALGIRLGLALSPPNNLDVRVDPGFCLPREHSYDAQKAILVGWVQQESLAMLEAVVRSSPIPRLDAERTMPVSLEWLLGAGHQLEMAGVLSNSDLLLSDILERR